MAVPSFTEPVPDDGYRWWYLDAVSNDEQHAITVIAFIGSVFSPYYARARKKAPTPANQHCSINVALYGKPWRWCMTERSANSLKTTDERLCIGSSQIHLDKASISNRQLKISVNEWATPLFSRLQGEITVNLPNFELDPVPLDSENFDKALHFWQPIAPQTSIEVSFSKPQLNWQGSAYVDSNYGTVPLERSFKQWVWSRSHNDDKSTSVLYDVTDRNGMSRQRSLSYSANGTRTEGVASEKHHLPPTRYWRIARNTRTPAGSTISKLQTLEDTPFYSRSRFIEQNNGRVSQTVHESLFLDRFDTAWVRSLLPFRMPRNQRTVLID